MGPFLVFTEWKGQLHIPTGALFETTIHPSDLYPSAINEKRRLYFTLKEAQEEHAATIQEEHAATIQELKTTLSKEKGN